MPVDEQFMDSRQVDGLPTAPSITDRLTDYAICRPSSKK